MNEANLIELFRKALMVEHADDWTMDTIAEAAHVCARTLAQPVNTINERLHVLLGIEPGLACEHACTHVVFGQWSALGAANVLGRHS